MLVQVSGGYDAAMARLRAKGWRPLALTAMNAVFRCAAKAGAVIAFGPDGDFASEPGVPNGMAGFVPLPRGDALREEGMDCVCGTGA